MAEFALHGYEAARIDAIAARAGLSKGGFYAHFDSKEALFGALLRHVLALPTIEITSLPAEAKDLRSALEQLVELLTARLLDHDAAAVLRLLISDGWRMPDIVRPWHWATLEAVLNAIRSFVQQCVDRGLCDDSALALDPWFVLSPFMHAAMQHLLTGWGDDMNVGTFKKGVIDVLLRLLAPAA